MRTILWFWEQKTYGCKNKTFLKGKNLWLGKEIIACGNKNYGKNK
jgi:hypothetical protein